MLLKYALQHGMGGCACCGRSEMAIILSIQSDLDLARSFFDFVMSETLTIGFVNEPFLFINQRAIKYVRHSVLMRHSCGGPSYSYGARAEICLWMWRGGSSVRRSPWARARRQASFLSLSL